ncbi:hypothetical protein FND48_02320 [Bacillus sp. PW192]|nr:hypothetical protein FH490_00125 [Bacillus velezensis]TNU36384.1 hypothetical protein FH493_04820 [Bacillus velezensis]TRW40235.1 hypothetical protein FND48_02320 [Bacillus sp. PW192]
MPEKLVHSIGRFTAQPVSGLGHSHVLRRILSLQISLIQIHFCAAFIIKRHQFTILHRYTNEFLQ